MNGHEAREVGLIYGSSAIAQSAGGRLERAGWQLQNVHPDGPASMASIPLVPEGLSGVLYDPGLAVPGADGERRDHADELTTLVELVRPQLLPRSAGGARVVVICDSQGLAWPGTAEWAARSAALATAAFSLAFELAPAGICVNVIAASLGRGDASANAPEPPENVADPVALLNAPVTADDVAEAAWFLLHRRSSYITGQVIHCCGGANLLSRLSA